MTLSCASLSGTCLWIIFSGNYQEEYVWITLYDNILHFNPVDCESISSWFSRVFRLRFVLLFFLRLLFQDC